jgi:hypothetical protein
MPDPRRRNPRLEDGRILTVRIELWMTDDGDIEVELGA